MSKPALRNSQRRNKKLHTIALSDEAWERLVEIARRWGQSRSGVVERLVREAPMPR